MYVYALLAQAGVFFSVVLGYITLFSHTVTC